MMMDSQERSLLPLCFPSSGSRVVASPCPGPLLLPSLLLFCSVPRRLPPPPPPPPPPSSSSSSSLLLLVLSFPDSLFSLAVASFLLFTSSLSPLLLPPSIYHSLLPLVLPFSNYILVAASFLILSPGAVAEDRRGR